MWKVLFVAFLANLIVHSKDVDAMKCGEYERYDECPERVCEPRSCLELGLPMDCSMSNCYKPACLCIEGYVRNETAVCIPIDECGDNDINTCVEDNNTGNYIDNGCNGDANATRGCDIDCIMRCPGQETSGSCSCPVNSCKCKENYLFNTENYECVLPKDCPNYEEDMDDEENYENNCPCQCQCKNDNNNDYNTTECTTDSNMSEMPLGNCPDAIEAFKTKLYIYNSEIIYMKANKYPQTSFAGSILATFFQLAQLALFSYGKTFAELSKALNLKTKDEIRCSLRTVKTYYDNFPSSVNFRPVLDIYGNISNPFTCEFKKSIMTNIGGEAKSVNFNKRFQAADEINESVLRKTDNLVTDVITNYYELNSKTSLVWIAAAFFQAEWKYGFDPQNTITDDFYVTPTKTVKAQYMVQSEIYNYTESVEIGAQVIKIPFAAEGLNLYIVLPFKKDGLLEVLKKFTNLDVYLSVLNDLKLSPVNVKIPKMSSSTLTNTLSDIKAVTPIRTIFDRTIAEFKNITYGQSEVPVEVSLSIQRLTLATTEKGGPSPNTECGAMAEQYVFFANHPFSFVVSTNYIPIYSGVVANLDGIESSV